MKKKLLSILLLLASCTSPKQEDLLIHNLDTDFSTADTLFMKYKQTFNFVSYTYDFAIKDTILLASGNNNENIGHCYSINNGALITTIINCGNAANETRQGTIIRYHRDSIQFIDQMFKEIKLIAINDILTKPMGEREFSRITIPTTIKSFYYKKIDNNVVIGYNDANNKDAKYFIFENNKLTQFGEYNKKILVSTVNQELTNDIAAHQYNPKFASYGSKIISADRSGVTLETIDINTKSILNERFYTKITFGEQFKGSYSSDPIDMYTEKVYCTDKEIYCIVKQINKVKSKEEGGRFVDLFILVFDWDLNPIKKYYIGSSTFGGYSVCMTEDCKKFYYLAMEEEKQTLFEGIINYNL